MFGKLKDLNEMRKQAAQMQATLAEEKVELENKGIKIVLNGKMEVLAIEINNELGKDELAKELTELFNEAIKKIQRIMATKMMGQF